jgi:hypothetical protein
MSYSKTTWVNNTTALSADNLNHVETQYDEAVAAMNTVDADNYLGDSGRVLDTIYENTSGKPRWVSVTSTVGANKGIVAYIGATSPPTSEVGRNYGASSPDGRLQVMFLVPPGWFYKATAAGGGQKAAWYEWTLH